MRRPDFAGSPERRDSIVWHNSAISGQLPPVRERPLYGAKHTPADRARNEIFQRYGEEALTTSGIGTS